MKKTFLLTALAMSSCLASWAQVSYDIIPRPQSVEQPKKTGELILTANAEVGTDTQSEAMTRLAGMVVSNMAEGPGLQVAFNAKAKKPAIMLALGLKSENKEAYKIEVDKKGVTIQGATEEGVFRGIQSLYKILGTEQADTLRLPYVTIQDEPRFGYRGVHMDVARHFFDMKEVKQYIDILALHGCNQLHWHITDDQGWRFEVKSMPELAKKSSIRKQTVIGHNLPIFDGQEYGRDMYFTQEQCREIVQYAAERYINIIPEIDLPGHMVAALHVYPELGCTGGPYDVWGIWGVSADVLCAGNPQVLPFLKKVLDEVCEVFPSKYIHIGGDESPRDRWKACPKCQAKMKELGLKHESELQTYINKELEKYIAEKHGRRIIGWDETLEGGLSEDAIVMSWRGNAGGIQAAKLHHEVVMTPNSECYFDYYQLKNHNAQPMAIGGYIPVSKVYSLEPVPAELTEEEGKYILGAQCNLWSEYITAPEHLEFMLLPRLAALCEVQWTKPELKNLENFKARLPRMMKMYDRKGWKYCPWTE